MKAKNTKSEPVEPVTLTLSSLDVGKEEFNVVAERRTLQAERKKQADWPLAEYRRRMGNAPQMLRAKLAHLRSIAPATTVLAHSLLGKYPPAEDHETQGVKKAVDELRRECIGALNRLNSLPPAIGNVLENITTNAAQRVKDFQLEFLVAEDSMDVAGYENCQDFVDFPERMATLENQIKVKVRQALADQRNGTAAPVDLPIGGPPTEQSFGVGLGEVIVVRNIHDDD